MDITTTQGMKQALTDKLRLGFGVTPEEADDAQVMRAAALVLRDVMTERGVESRMARRIFSRSSLTRASATAASAASPPAIWIP